MSNSRSNSSLPTGLIEADVIDLMDGCLPPEREGVVLAALKSHPELAVLAKQFRSDRNAVALIGLAHAPAGLAEGIEARLEAAALRDLASASDDALAPIPISQVVVREPGVLRLLMDTPWTRRLATAASIAIVGTLGWVGLRPLLRSTAPAIVFNNPSGPSGAGPSTTPIPIVPEAPLRAVEIADRTPDWPPTAPTEIATVAPATSPGAPLALAAAQLAAEGRLAITVRIASSPAALKRIEALAKARDTGWRPIALDAPEQYASLLTPAADAAAPQPSVPGPKPTTIASADGSGPSRPTVPAPTGPGALPPLHPVVKAIYAVEITPGEQPLESLLRSISDTLPDGATVTLRTLPQPIAAPVTLDPDAVLWWNNPTGRWSRRSRVPVVIETLE